MQAWITLWPSIFTLWQIGRVMAMWVMTLFQKKKEKEKKRMRSFIPTIWKMAPSASSDCWWWIKIYNGFLKVIVTYTLHPFSKLPILLRVIVGMTLPHHWSNRPYISTHNSHTHTLTILCISDVMEQKTRHCWFLVIPECRLSSVLSSFAQG